MCRMDKRRSARASHLDVPCVGPHDCLRQLHDLVGQRRGEEQRLALGRQRGDDALDIGPEAHVHHPVRLVEHEHLEPSEVGRRRAHVIHQAARRRDDDRDARAQCAILRVHRHAAIDRRAGDLRVVRQTLDRVFDLDGQLACGRENQRARASQLLVGHVEQAVQDRQHERDRLAGAGLRGRQHVVSGERVRNDGALYGPRLEIAHVLHALEQ